MTYVKVGIYQKICLLCNAKFIAHRRTTKFCSPICALNKRRQNYKCKICGKILSGYRTIYCLNCKQKGELNHMWVGDKVMYDGLHSWVKKRLKKPKFCEMCNEKPPLDLANKGIYNRELKNWEWLCRKCHMVKDGRIIKLHSKKIRKKATLSLLTNGRPRKTSLKKREYQKNYQLKLKINE